MTRKLESVVSIKDTDSETDLPKTALEPEILSSIAAEGDGRRKVVTFKDLPPHLVKAITVTEDRAFFEHYGVNLRGIARALWRKYDGENGNSAIENQGGSSITQQLVKNLLAFARAELRTEGKRSIYVGDTRNPAFKTRDFYALRQPDLSRTKHRRFDLWRRGGVQHLFRKRCFGVEPAGSRVYRRNNPQSESLQSF